MVGGGSPMIYGVPKFQSVSGVGPLKDPEMIRMMDLSLTQSQIAIKPATMIGINSAFLKSLSIHIVHYG